MAQEVEQAAKRARDTDRATLRKAHDRRHHTVREQRLYMLYTGLGAAMAVMLRWLVYPG